MRVRIVSGTYGRRENGRLNPVQKGCSCILDENEAKRLISLGVAVQMPDEDEPHEQTPAERDRILLDMTKTELKALAKEQGIDLTGCKTKMEMVIRLESPVLDDDELDLTFSEDIVV